MTKEDLVKDLAEINRRLSYDLWNVSCFGDKPSGLSPRLIFPKKRIKNKKNKDVKRISEQEARILYCNILNNLNYFYSIETPTNKPYQFNGKTQSSALSDLSIYLYINNEFEKLGNVELKAHNPAIENFSKDIEKIIRERKDGNWFHVLKNVDEKTLPSVFEKFVSSFKTHEGKGSKKFILFCICILEKKFSIIKHFDYDPSFGKDISNIMEEFFCLSKTSDLNNIEDKSVLDQKDILKNNGWTIIEP